MGGSENSSVESLTVTHLRMRKEVLQVLVAGIHDAVGFQALLRLGLGLLLLLLLLVVVLVGKVKASSSTSSSEGGRGEQRQQQSCKAQ